MKKRLLLFFYLVFLSFCGFSQKIIKGFVKSSDDNVPLPGVSVRVKGTNSGTQTGPGGTFSIEVPGSKSVLVFTYIGYASREVSVGSQVSLNVVLSPDANQLGEVIITGYAAVRREQFTGAAVKVGGEAIKDRPVQSFAQALTGKAAGVNIVQPNGLLNNAPVIRIRGVNSISLSSFPLVVLDGIPISTENQSSNSSANNPLADINPLDIESVEVLKDAATTSIYGSRGANGVLVITTKKGKKGSSKFTYDGWTGINKATRLPELLNAQQYMDYKNEAIKNALADNPGLSTSALPRNTDNVGFLPSYNEDGSMVDTRWYDEAYHNGVSQNHSLSVSGGTEKTSYYFSAGYSDQNGFIIANTFGRKNARLNMSHKVADWFTFRGNISYSNTMNKSPNSGSIPGAAYNSSGLARLALALPPNIAPRNPDGSYNISTSNTIGQGANVVPITFLNPLPLIDLNRNSSENSRVISNFGADVRLLKGLNFRSNYSLDFGNTENIQFWNPLQGDGYSYGGYAYNRTVRRENWSWSNVLQYDADLGKMHRFYILAGTEAQKILADGWGGIRQGLTIDGFDQYQAGFNTNVDGGNTNSEREYLSYLSSLNYSYAGKYFLNANFRRDGNSALAKTNRWGNFGGASLGWQISEEGFFKNSFLSSSFDRLKIKTSYGRVGNGNLNNDYGSYSLFSTGLYGDQATLIYSQTGNPALFWETSDQLNIGIEGSLFRNKLTFELDYYKNDISGLILDAPQTPSKGIPDNKILRNIGGMYNRGFEFSLSATPVSKKNFSWTSSFNFTANKNRVTETAENLPITGATGSSENTNITKAGYSLGSLYGVQTGGVNPENGRRIFINKAGELVQYQHLAANPWTYLDGTKASPVSGADAMVIKNALPTWYGGFNNTFTYKRFDLSLSFVYSGGNYIYNGTKAGLRDQRFWNNDTGVLNRWTATGQKTDVPRPIFGDNVSNGSTMVLDVNMEKGDFVRLQNTVIGYRLPTGILSRAGVSSARVYVQADNLFIITNYSGTDPEVSVNGNSTTAGYNGNLAPGVERNSVPQGRMFTFGVNVSF